METVRWVAAEQCPAIHVGDCILISVESNIEAPWQSTIAEADLVALRDQVLREHCAYPTLLAACVAVAMSPSPVCTGAHGRGCDCIGDRVRAALKGQDDREQEARARRQARAAGLVGDEADLSAASVGGHDAPQRSRPEIVCLCGSTRFKFAFDEANRAETMAGRIVLSVGFFMHASDISITPEQKAALDVLHLCKIELADRVIVVSDATGYYGESTTREIAHAQALGKPVEFRSFTHP